MIGGLGPPWWAIRRFLLLTVKRKGRSFGDSRCDTSTVTEKGSFCNRAFTFKIHIKLLFAHPYRSHEEEKGKSKAQAFSFVSLLLFFFFFFLGLVSLHVCMFFFSLGLLLSGAVRVSGS